ncbi:MAG: NUDIX domain-containing protein [Fusobacteria bacterium]|nr:NUDIX domain-containing protein [Fusobacteriota bacterium]
MVKVNFLPCNSVIKTLKYAVIVTRYYNRWVLVKHKERSSWEIPAGRKEAHETIEETAHRELFEETGAIVYDLKPITIYSVEIEGVVSYGKLFFADVLKFYVLPESEIEKIEFFEEFPENLTYPLIQRTLLEKVKSTLGLE